MTLLQFLVWLTSHTCAIYADPTHIRFIGPCLDAFAYGPAMHLPVTLWTGPLPVGWP